MYLSPLLFPSRPYHALLKDDKLETDELNNPLNDAKKAQELFDEEVSAFQHTQPNLQDILCSLLYTDMHFFGFFKYLEKTPSGEPVERNIRAFLRDKICEKADIGSLIQKHPVELAYCLALIKATECESITPPWVLKNYPDVERLMALLRNRPCIEGCSYCNQVLDVHAGRGMGSA